MAVIAADLAFAVAALFVGVQLVVALVNARAFPRLPAPSASRPAAAPRVSLLVPARDEADTLPETLPRWLRQGADEVLVLNDASSDGTGAILARAAVDEPRLRVLDGEPLPDGWNGKNWACHQLARAARGDLLVFTDADVRWEDGALDALLLAWTRHRPGLLTVWPRQRTGGLYERLIVPQVDMILLGALPHPAVRLPFATLAGANGQLMAWTRGAYERAGGHAAVRGEVLEDVRLAQRAKAAGVRLHLALGHPLLSTRMYRGARATVQGFAKNVLVAAGSAPVLVALTLVNLLAYTAAWPLAWVQPRWAAIAAGGLALRAITAARSGRSPLEAPLQALAPLALLPIVGLALARRGGYAWRGRRYPAGGHG